MTRRVVEPPFRAITLKARGGKLREIRTDAEVFVSRDISKLFSIPMKSAKVQAIWDTGATNTVISEKLVAQLGLIPTGKITCNAVNEQYQADTHIVDIELPDKMMIGGVQVTAGKNLGNYDLLIGMDLTTLGDMAITNSAGITWFSFRFPPDPIRIDYVEKSRAIMNKKLRREKNKAKPKRKRGK